MCRSLGIYIGNIWKLLMFFLSSGTRLRKERLNPLQPHANHLISLSPSSYLGEQESTTNFSILEIDNYMHVYVFVLRILNRKNTYILHFDFFFNVSHICFTVFDLLLYIFSLTLLRVHCRRYTLYRSVQQLCILGTSILSTVIKFRNLL